jgi:phospholipase C
LDAGRLVVFAGLRPHLAGSASRGSSRSPNPTSRHGAGSCAARSDGPWTFTIEAGRRLSYTWSAQAATQAGYDFSVHGPNGFLCQFKGNFPSDKDRSPTQIEVGYVCDASAGNIRLRLTNRGAAMRQVLVANAYDDEKSFTLRPGGSAESAWVLAGSHGWYDLSVTTSGSDGFLRRIAGHVETGRASFTDPANGMG